MLSIFSFFFMRGREVLEMVVSTREEVDWETWGGGTPKRGRHPPGDTPPPPPEVTPAATRARHLAHDLAAVEEHLVPFSEAILRCPLGGYFWGPRWGHINGGRPCHPPVPKATTVLSLTLKAQPAHQDHDGSGDDDGEEAEAEHRPQHLRRGQRGPHTATGVPRGTGTSAGDDR